MDDAVIANLKKLAIQKFVSGLVRSMYTQEQLKIYKKSAKKGGTVTFPEDAKKYIKGEILFDNKPIVIVLK